MVEKGIRGGICHTVYLFKIDQDFMKNYDKDSDKGYILEVDVKYPKNLHDLHSDLLFLPESYKIFNDL